MLAQMSADALSSFISNLSLATVSGLREDLCRLPPSDQISGLIEAAEARILSLASTEAAWEPLLPMLLSFAEEVNSRGLSVLEIGSRVGSDETPAKKPHFHGASEYVGFDFHEGPNVDIVGDVHDLTKLLAGKSFGAICSFSVLEHLAMPWVAALEMVNSLNVGGIMFHHVPFSFPMHELPWDFWRFTPEAYKVLFPARFGMTIEKTGCEFPLRLTFDDHLAGQENFNLQRSFGFTGAYARKVRDVDLSNFRWDMTLVDAVGAGSVYPTKWV